MTLCECGCGGETNIYMGIPRRFIKGHQWIGKIKSEEFKKKVSVSLSNRPEDIWKKINIKPTSVIWYLWNNECWKWTTKSINNKGYGMFSITKKMYLAHRIVYKLVFGAIPDNLYILHHCDNPLCCNPSHLFPGTQKNNMEDMIVRGRQCCGEKISSSKLKEKDILEIRILYSTGDYYQRELGEIYGVGADEISRIVNNKMWKHIRGD